MKRPRHLRSVLRASGGALLAALWVPSPASPQSVTCDVGSFTASPGLRAASAPTGVELEWDGRADERVLVRLAVVDGAPVVRRLAVRAGAGPWIDIATDAAIEYRVVEGLRRISNQQLVPLRELGVELTSEVVDRYKWDVFWDAPLDLRNPPPPQNNPPPVDGVAHQPGLPRSPNEVRRATATWDVSSCRVIREGRRATVALDGLTLGSFQGSLELSVHEGTNLVEVEVVASTALPSVAYKYDVGITGLDVEGARIYWRDLAGAMQSYAPVGPVHGDDVVLKGQNRLVVAETPGAALAAFPPPHTYFWAREVEIVVGNNWYRKDDAGSFGIGVRQGEQEVVERYLANWSLHSAPPGTEQRMPAFFYPTVGDHRAAFDGALAFTNGDVYRRLDGYRVLGSHYHTNVGRELQAAGSVDARLPDFEVLRAAGLDIVGPVDRPRDATQLEELDYLFRGAERHSDDSFVVMPQMENSNLLGGHWDLLFSHPVLYVDERPEGTPLVTEHPEYGRVYNIGSAEDMRTMIEREEMLVFMPHPRTKGSTGYPDAIADTPHFLSDWYRGVGWRWGMGSDLSERRLSGKRVLPLLDDMNNWIANTDLQPKGLLAITETYFKAPGDDVYANGPVTYLPMDALPPPGEYGPIVDALRGDDYFVTSGEVLVPQHRYEGSGREAVAVAEVAWTFPLDFVEVVAGDGGRTETWTVSAKDLPAFGRHTFRVPFDATGARWVRIAAWDTAGNGATTMPVRLR